MQFLSSFVFAALALLPLSAMAVDEAASEIASSTKPASTNGTLSFCLGVKHADGTCKYTDDYLADFEVLAPYTNMIRTYATSDCNTLEYLLPALAQSPYNFSAILGVWPTDDAHYDLEKQALMQYLPQYGVDHVRAITVGSEVLYRNDLPADVLAERIYDVRGLVQQKLGFDVPVGTADSWNLWAGGNGDVVITASDFIMSNDFPYWQGQNTSNMTNTFISDTLAALERVQSVKGTNNVTFWVGETGWPTDGPSYGEADATVDIASEFFQEALCNIRRKGIDIFFFEAFDEDWKGDSSSVEPYFGAMYSNRTLKYNLNCTSE